MLRSRASLKLLLGAWPLAAASALQVYAANNWTNVGSGLWRLSTNWSLATVPNATSGVDPTQITNAGTKTVTIDSATLAANLSLRGLTISAPAGASNTLLVANTGAALVTSRAFLISNGGRLQITNAAVAPGLDFDIVNGALILDSGSLNCGLNCDLQAGSILVNGGTLTATSLVSSTGIRMGRLNGAQTSLTINGGTVDALRLTLGSVSGSQNSLTIAGGTLLAHDYLSLGQLPATTGDATLTAGNLIVTNGTTKIADRAAATFSQSGGNAFFADLHIGDVGLGAFNLSGGQMSVLPRTTNDLTIVGNLESGVLNQSGGVAIIQSELHIADNPGIAGDVFVLGGQFFATNDLAAIGRYGIGTMTISNATAVLTNVSVGRHDTADGTLRVQNNANVGLISDLSIGRLLNANGHVFVEGGLLSLPNDSIWVGRDGTGDFTVSGGIVRAKTLLVGKSEYGTNTPAGTATFSGGVTSISSNCILGTSLVSTGQVSLAGGSLYVTNGAGTANLTVEQGTFALAGGILGVDTLVLTTNTGQFVFSQGTLQAKSMTVANGAPFVVGDGVNPATLEIQGGTFTFANGLVISPNATVTGCGTVIGPITTNGVYNNPCGGSQPAAPTISNLQRSGQTVTVTCVSQSGFTYTLEFKRTLADPAWTQILPGLPGNGGVLNLPDSAATNTSRFYRLSVK